MEKTLNYFMPKLGNFPAAFISLEYDENNFCYSGHLQPVRDCIVNPPKFSVFPRQIQDNIDNSFYLSVEDSLPLQVEAGLVITSIGQLTKRQTMQLNRAVKKGLIQKALGGPFPKAKIVYAPLNYDIPGERNKEVEKMLSFWTGGRLKVA